MGAKTQIFVARAILSIASATIAGALVFEALGYMPCELCLRERIFYYAAIPLAGLALFPAARRRGTFLRAAFLVLTLIFTASAGFGAYHAGVEWGFWPGPTECTGTLPRATTVEDFLKQLQTVKVVRCDSAALRILGLSLAGWNVMISAGLAALAVFGLRAKP